MPDGPPPPDTLMARSFHPLVSLSSTEIGVRDTDISATLLHIEPAGERALLAARGMMDRMWDGVELDGAGEPA